MKFRPIHEQYRLSDEERRFVNPAVRYRSRGIQSLLDDPSLLKIKPSFDNLEEVISLISDREYQARWQAERAKKYVEKVRREQRARTNPKYAVQKEGVDADPSFQVDLAEWDDELLQSLQQHFPEDVHGLIDPKALRYLQNIEQAPISYMGKYRRRTHELPSVEHVRFSESGVKRPYVQMPGTATLYGERGDTPSIAAHEMRHLIYDRGIPSLLPVTPEEETNPRLREILESPRVTIWKEGLLRKTEAAKRGLEEAGLPTEEENIRLRDILSAQDPETLLKELEQGIRYNYKHLNKSARRKIPVYKDRDGKLRLESRHTKNRRGVFLEELVNFPQALNTVVPELLKSLNLPTKVEDWQKRADKVVVSPLVASYLEPPDDDDGFFRKLFDHVSGRTRQRIKAHFPHLGEDTIEMPEDYRAGGRVRLI